MLKYGFIIDPLTKAKTFYMAAEKDVIKINSLPKSGFVIYDIFPYGDEMVLKYTSAESEGKFYLTQLEKSLAEGDKVPSITFNQAKPTYRSLVDAKDGYLTLTDNDNNGFILIMKKEDDTLVAHSIRTLAPMNESDYKWLGTSYIYELP